MNASLRLTHYISLRAFGGVERQFSEFFAHADAEPGLAQTAVLRAGQIHPLYRAHVTELLASRSRLRFERSWRGIRLPRRMRGWNARRTARALGTDVALLWNRMDQQLTPLRALGPQHCLYWEHGSAWLPGGEASKREVAAQLQGVICNSYAAQRMLELRWGYHGPVRICPNGLSPLAIPACSPERRLPSDRPLRLGTASRLVSLKGTAIALHAVKLLRASGCDVHLLVAGDGPLRARLQALAHTLGIAEWVAFAGVVENMPAFFDDIDCLLHPALREPFGMVCIEAAARGCPVICTRVDGLPEVVADDRTGVCVTPEMDIDSARAMDIPAEDLPAQVFDPGSDALAGPAFITPTALADAVERLFDNAGYYEAMCAAAATDVPQRFDFADHVRQVLAAVRRFAAGKAV